MMSLASTCVLVIEDDKRNAALIAVMLKIVGVPNTWICETGRTINETLAKMPKVDLILIDLQLPEEDGYQILQRLRRQPELQKVPMVAMTAQVMPDDVEHARAVGFSGFIGKPLIFDRFPGQIHRLLMGERVWEPR